jgi:hypothetical protein
LVAVSTAVLPVVPAVVDVVLAVPLSVPVLAVMGAGVLRGAVGVVGLAARLVPLGLPGVLAVLFKQVPDSAAVPDDGPVARGAAGPLAVTVPGDLRDVLVSADVGVALAGTVVPDRRDVRVPVVSGLALVVAGLASGVDFAAFKVAAGAARSGVPMVGIAVRAVLVADLFEVPGEVVVPVVAGADRHGAMPPVGFPVRLAWRRCGGERGRCRPRV